MKLGVILVLLSFCFPVYFTKTEIQLLLFKCPSKTEWSFRANWYCKANGGFPAENYACLYNEIRNISSETCNFKAHPLEKGQQYILRHRPVGNECKDKSMYQPFRFTEFSGHCAFRRSICSEPGHVRFHEGTSIVDRSCRCNFEKGYAFVSKPKRNCYCIPSREDCSCYQKNCPTDYVVTSDYHCIHKNNKSYIPACPDINSQRNYNLDEMKYPRHNDDHNEKVPDFQRKTLKYTGLVCLVIDC